MRQEDNPMSIDQSVLDKFEAVVESQRKRIMDMKA